MLKPLDFSQILIASFFTVCFLQSGLDKVFEYKENLLWLSEHFNKSIFKNFVSVLLVIVTFLELMSGAFCLWGVSLYLIYGSTVFIFKGLSFCALTLVFLFFGQRIAKDYDGAAVILNYFTLTILGLLSFHLS